MHSLNQIHLHYRFDSDCVIVWVDANYMMITSKLSYDLN